MKTYHNLAFYKFVRINDVDATAAAFRALTQQLDIKGTLIFADEGVNGYIAASPDSANKFIAYCRADARFADIEFKVSFSDFHPYTRMLVKQKKEIVTLGRTGIDPAHFTGKHVDGKTLKQWLDNGEEVILLDTRNDYETQLGTFKNAIVPDIKTFRTFPGWVEDNFMQHKNKRVVTFCTGGIRCEKATAYMRQVGFEDVYQIQGGILKYFDQTQQMQGDNHYEGDCFVFDHRVAVNAKLSKTEHDMCYVCWATLSPEDKLSPLYKENEYCPHCADETQRKMEARKRKAIETNQIALEKRFERIRKARAQWEAKSREGAPAKSVAADKN
ncbi:rhodanese-related sulfurtransferase [bacterium]|nr:rhodanese-related sulfurtransferase [bacterium]